ncbi:MAG: hypothetical protein IPM77_14345 [Crocinitomicaceae bacterium]|nr:hypothetical protein [Crocinitomicaceae bacterium]
MNWTRFIYILIFFCHYKSSAFANYNYSNLKSLCNAELTFNSDVLICETINTGELSPIDSSNRHFLNIPNKINYYPLSIKFSYHPGLLGNSMWSYMQQASRIYCYNSTWYIEPEWNFSDKWTVGLPLVFGSGVSKNGGTHIGPLSSPAYSYLEEYYYQVYGTYPSNDFPAIAKNEYSYSLDFESLCKIHRPELVFQTGLSVKYYPFGQKLNAFYLGQQLSFGRGNYNQANFYIDADTAGYYSDWDGYVAGWTTAHQTIVYRPSYFNYLNYTTKFGIDFNISKIISFNAEASFSNAMKNRGVSDSIFVSRFNEPYIFLRSENNTSYNDSFYTYNSTLRVLRENIVFRLQLSLLIKLGTKRKED